MEFKSLLQEYPNDHIVTRFPPEPNGYIHLGHAKAMYINFNFAKSNNGICYMRFDDTNPTKEKQEYIDSILDDVHWLGNKPYLITYTSDYFDHLYQYAEKMILIDKAYICQLDDETIRHNRRNGIDSPYRNRPVKESLILFREMKEGKHQEGSMILRLKGDMKSANMNMRDMVAYRILFREHARTGNKWVIYPTYDFSHPIVDSLEGITHSLCSSEFIIRNELYRWILNTLEISGPPQIEYSRLNTSHTVLSKRILTKLVDIGIASGWNDPRMPTIKGLRRKGFTANAINDFCGRLGLAIGGDSSRVSYGLLEECLREDLNNTAPRVMAIMDPIRVKIINIPDNEYSTVHAMDFPALKEKSSTHPIKVGNIIYIDRSDFRLEDSPKYYRMAPNKIVRLKYLGLVKCTGYEMENNEVKSISIELLDPDYKPAKRIQGTLNWVSDCDHIKIEVRKYDHLFPEEFNKNADMERQININSKTIMHIMTDTSVSGANIYDKFQFERIGYFSVDPDSTRENIVMNFTVGLQENKNKQSK